MIRSFVRKRKTVKADRAGMDAHSKLVAALGGSGSTMSSVKTTSPDSTSFDKHVNDALSIHHKDAVSRGAVYDQEMDK